MAKYTIRYACGHSTERQLYGKHAERDSYIAWAARQGSCDACRKQDTIKTCEGVEAEHGLPALAGSDKQVAWARQIRADKLTAVTGFFGRARPLTATPEQLADVDVKVAQTLTALASKVEARWWIDNRELTARDIAILGAREAGALT